jgi:glutamate-ammonia-ligase adenylyltransferase
MPRGSDPSRNTKLGPGGLSDVEWVVQLLQLRHAGALPELRTTATLPALQAATDADLIGESDAVILRDAWTLASRIRNGIMLLRGRASDSLPTDTRELGALAEVLGFTKGEASVLQETYLKATRQARAVMDRLFWED